MKKKNSDLWRLRNQNEFLRKELKRLRRHSEYYPQKEKDIIEALIKKAARSADSYSKELYKGFDRAAKALYEDLRSVLNDKEISILANTDVYSQHSGRAEALVRPRPPGEKQLIFIDVFLFHFIFSLTKCILPVLKASGPSYFLDLKLSIALRKSMNVAGEVGRYFGNLWQYLALGGMGGTFDGSIQYYSIQDTLALGSCDFHLLFVTVAQLEQFVIAHEIAHVLLGHTGKLRAVHCCHLGLLTGTTDEDHFEHVSIRDGEFEADSLALELVLRTTGKRRFLDMPEAAPWRFEGALMLLSYLEFLEKCTAAIQLRGADQHPPASERIENLTQRRSLDLMFSNDIVRLGLPTNTPAFSIIPAVRKFLTDAAELTT
jgi:hypothetical protein